jgi:hypothetical protein
MVSSLPLRTSQKSPWSQHFSSAAPSQDLKNQKGTEPEAFPGPGGVLPDQPVVKMILIWMAKHGCLYVYTAY